jgi:hypothetical protein
VLDGSNKWIWPTQHWSLSLPWPFPKIWTPVLWAKSVAVLYPNEVVVPLSFWYALKTVVVLVASKELPPSLKFTEKFASSVAGWIS